MNYVLTWSPFGYVGSLISFIEFSHIFKKKSPSELRVDLIPFRVRRQLGIIYWVQSHLQKKKNPLLNYVLTWSSFGYVGNSVSFIEFSHIFKKKNFPFENPLWTTCLLGLNPIVWCYVWYYVWHYVWHDVWLNIVINKFFLLLSEIVVTWIFRHYHIVMRCIVCDLCEKSQKI